MIKQELNILQDKGYMNMTDKRLVIEAALLDCEESLQASYDIIKAAMNQESVKSGVLVGGDYVLQNINISLTILKLMKESH